MFTGTMGRFNVKRDDGTLRRSIIVSFGSRNGRWKMRINGTLLAAVGALILLLILPAVHRHQHLEMVQRTFVQDVERLGGGIVLAPTGTRGAPPPLLAVNLGGVPIGGDLINRLSTYTTIERLNRPPTKFALSHATALRRTTSHSSWQRCMQ